MDEYVVNTFANRDDPIPVIAIPTASDEGASDDGASTLDKEQLSPDSETSRDTDEPIHRSGHKRSSSLQDRIFAKLLQQVVPASNDDVPSSFLRWTPSSSKYLNRPGFSLPLMTNNFRRFNARIGVVFVFQANAIRLFTWQKYSHTLSFLALYSFVCIYPYLLVVAPFCLVLFFVMVPSYLARHPPPPTPSTTGPRQALDGPPIAPARVIKPASEMSHDFFHNMRDLQNVMDDFAVIHDLVLEVVTPYTNFANQELSSAVFLLLTCAIFCLYLAAPLIPWRAVSLLGGWAIVLLGHPGVQEAVSSRTTASDAARMRSQAGTRFHAWVAADMCIDEEAELLDVEVFELQHRRLPPSFHAEPSSPISRHIDTFDGEASSSPPDSAPPLPPRPRYYAPLAAAEWEPWLFSASAWEPQLPARLAGERPRGTRFFEDVRPPPGWAWADKKWLLDLDGQAWVHERLLGGLEVEVEGERWVYDLVGGGGSQKTAAGGADPKKGRKGRKSGADADEKDEPMYRGEWRRRRWVRTVRRAKVGGRAVKVLSDDGARKETGKGRR